MCKIFTASIVNLSLRCFFLLCFIDNDTNLGSRPLRAPTTSKEVVANLPTIIVTKETLTRLGFGEECAVCSENLVINDKMQEFPCKHWFHPLCLMPWLEKHNSCPKLVCRHELPTRMVIIKHMRVGNRPL
ncbi:hypothetical protein MKX03_022948 [Papaver bracteatum]|nr:hypothetical protein MKX03_022948 [Papaver bracteatum]